MRILAWNLNHRAHQNGIPDEAVSIIKALEPDVVVVNEYLDGSKQNRFKDGLREMGLRNISVSEKIEKSNQVLIASAEPHSAGDIKPPDVGRSSATNFHHVVFQDSDLEIVGLRVPEYTKARKLRTYWSSLNEIIDSSLSRRIVYVGDMNCDPDRPLARGGRELGGLRKHGWNIPKPLGKWSYISRDGRRTSRNDHVVASPHMGGVQAKYVASIPGHVAAGPKAQSPVSDHAILVVDIEPGPARAGRAEDDNP